MTINNKVGKYLINKVDNLTIKNKVRNDMINKVTNMIINDVGKNLNKAKAIDV